MTNYESIKKKIKDAIEISKKIEQKSKNYENENNADDDQIDCDPNMAKEADKNEADLNMPQIRHVTEVQVLENEQKLNFIQKEIYNEIISKLEQQNLHWNEENPIHRCNCDDCPQILKFINGFVDVGKSFLINALADKITLTYPAINGPSVVICAPTGVSAYILKGSTCHRVFQLNVQHGSTPKYEPLSKDKIKSLRTMLGYARLFIIDEISMVSHLQLAFIHQRLQDVFGDIRKQVYPFANMSIVAFGDLFQLPPVNEKPVFSKISIQDARKSNLGIAGINLWSYFDYDELTINVRQKDDNENFVNILNRIRLESPTD